MNNKSVKKMLVSFASILLLSACGNSTGAEDSSSSEGTKEGEKKVAVVVNQRFGDNGPMDNLAGGMEKVREDFGIEVKSLESSSAANFEEDLRAMSSQGYDMIVSTFAYMTDATKIVSKEFPDTKYAAIFQAINTDTETHDNIWDTEFHGEAAFYIAGYVAGLTTKTNNIGLIIGGEEPSPNAEGNGFMRGVKEANPDATVQFSFVGSYEDPAKAKEIALAMINAGADYVQANAGASNAGIVEAAQNMNVLVAGEITDYYDQYEGFTGIVEIEFGNTFYSAVEMMLNDEFPGGEHGIQDLTNGGYGINWESYERFSENNEEYGDKMKEAIEQGKSKQAEIEAGDLVIEFDSQAPSWSNF